ncbi:MAG TPA: PspC domain-containing protein [Thermoguttaceae bacterium]|nr:PspC domain-containing protein [Thermoguttaceae bacterium]
MQSADVSSQEKLDQMLHNGSITEEDYQRLSQVMAGPSEQLAADQPSGTERGPFRKSWEHGVIGGLCAGCAEYFGVDPLVVRIVLIVACVLLSALSGVGLALIPLLYFALCAFIPWDEAERAKAFLMSGHPRLFVVAVASLFVVLPLLYSFLILPGLESIYSDMGIEVWSREFQQTLPGRAIDGGSEYRNWCQLNDGAIFLGAGIAALFTLFLGVVYSSLCRARLRKYYAIITVALGCAWMVFLVAGTFYPLVTMMETI